MGFEALSAEDIASLKSTGGIPIAEQAKPSIESTPPDNPPDTSTLINPNQHGQIDNSTSSLPGEGAVSASQSGYGDSDARDVVGPGVMYNENKDQDGATNSVPDLKLIKDDYSIQASIPGDDKAFIRAETPSQGVVEVTDIFRGELPKGSEGEFLSKALSGQETLPTKQLTFKNITYQPTINSYKKGGKPSESVLGKAGTDALKRINLEPTNYTYEVSRGKLNLIIDVTSKSL